MESQQRVQMNLSTKQKLSYRFRKQNYGVRRGGINWETEIDIYIQNIYF